MTKITTTDVLQALKMIGRSSTAEFIATYMAHERGFGDVTSRAVATAMRMPVADGRATITYRKGRGWYRFVRMAPKPEPKPAELRQPPELAPKVRAALLAVLWHHQGGSSPIGQPIRELLCIGKFEHLTPEQVRTAKDATAGIEAFIEPTPRGSSLHDSIGGTVARLKRYSRQGDNANNLLGQTMEEAAAFIQRAIAAGVR